MGIIYKITHKETNKCYIGQTKMTLENRLYSRLWGHCVKDTKYPCNTHIHNAIQKYGIDAFTYEIIEECDNDRLNEQEIYWIKYYDSFNCGYNDTAGGKNKLCFSLESRKKLSKSLSNRKLTDQQKQIRYQKMVEKGTNKQSDTAKQKIAYAVKHRWKDSRYKKQVGRKISKANTNNQKMKQSLHITIQLHWLKRKGIITNDEYIMYYNTYKQTNYLDIEMIKQKHEEQNEYYAQKR